MRHTHTHTYIQSSQAADRCVSREGDGGREERVNMDTRKKEEIERREVCKESAIVKLNSTGFNIFNGEVPEKGEGEGYKLFWGEGGVGELPELLCIKH